MANLSWGIDDPSVVTSFEIHGSDQEGFTPSASTREATLPSSEREFITSSNFDYYLIVVKRSSGNDLVSQPVRSVQAEGGDTPVLSSQEEDGGITLNASGDFSSHVSSDWVIVEDGESVGLSKNYLIYLEDESNLTSLNLAYYTGDDSSEGDELYPGSYEARVRFNGSGGMTTGWSDGYEFDVIALVDQPSIIGLDIDVLGNLNASSTQFSSVDSSDSHAFSSWRVFVNGELVNEEMNSSSFLTSFSSVIDIRPDRVWLTDFGENSRIRQTKKYGNHLYLARTTTSANPLGVTKTDLDGNVIWTVLEDKAPTNLDLDSSGMIYVVAVRTIYKIRPSDGQLQWEYQVPFGGNIHRISISPSGEIYISFGTGGGVWKITSSGDDIEWRNDEHSGQVNSVKFFNGFVYSASDDGTIKKISPSGNTEWTSQNFFSKLTSIDVDSSGIYTGDEDGTIRKHSLSDGSLLWDFDEINSRSILDIRVSDGRVVSSSQQSPSVQTQGNVVLLDSSSGNPIWKYSEASTFFSVEFGDNGIYVGSNNNLRKLEKELRTTYVDVKVRHRGSSGNSSPWSQRYQSSVG